LLFQVRSPSPVLRVEPLGFASQKGGNQLIGYISRCVWPM
jgi:hypothetical protein